MKLSVLAFPFVLTFPLMGAEKDAHWPHWRGPEDTGVSRTADPPVTWSETENVQWKVELPGMGHSTPVIWGERLYLTSAVPFGKPRLPVFDNAPGSHDNLPVTRSHRFVVMCVSRKDGAILWQQVVHEEFPHEGGHESGSLASASPVTDGEVVIAFFGSRGLHALDMEGKVLWKRHFGKMATKHGHGEGASPAMHGDTVIINWDHESDSAIYALDRKTGVEKWKVSRDEVTSWSSPIIVPHAGKYQVIVSATNRVRGYDLQTGEVIWECGGMSHNVVASPVYEDGMVYTACSYDKRAILGIKLEGAKGDITATDNLVWSTNQRTPYVPSPLLYDNTLYFLTHYQGILSCLTAKTGETKAGPFRLNAITNVYASPVAAAGRFYLTDLDGTTMVISHGDEPEPLATNRLDDSFSASATLAGKQLFLRGKKYLYCLAEAGD